MSRMLMASALLSAFTFMSCPGVVQAQEPTEPTESSSDSLPTPPDGWWEKVEGGESATYDMTQMGMQTKLKTTVDRREGSKITFTTTMEAPGMPPGALPPQTKTIDFADPEQAKSKMERLKDSTVKKLGEETITAAGREWECTIYEVEGVERGRKTKMKVWHSAELLPIFSNGVVKMEVDVVGPDGQPVKVEMTLTEVTGPGEGGAAPDGEKPEGDAPGEGQ